MEFIGNGQPLTVNQIHLSVFFRELANGSTDLRLERTRGFVSVAIEDFDARITDRIVAGGDHATHASIERKNGVMKGGRRTRIDVNNVASSQPEAKGQCGDQIGIVGALVPADHHRVSFTGECGLGVRQGFANQSHERRCEGSFLFQANDGRFLIHFVKGGPATDTVGSKEGHHDQPSSMEAVRLVDPGDGDVWPYDAVTSENNAGIHDAVASRGDPFAEHGTEFSKTAGDSFPPVSQVNLPSIVAEVAEFGSCSEVRTLSKNGITDVIEVGSFGAGQKESMFGFGCMTDHGIGTYP